MGRSARQPGMEFCLQRLSTNLLFASSLRAGQRVRTQTRECSTLWKEDAVKSKTSIVLHPYLFAPLRVTACAAALALVLYVTTLPAEPPDARQGAQPSPSKYAPAKDLLAEMQELRDHIRLDLEDQARYGKYQQQRIEMDANTLAALALVLGMHDQASSVKRNAGSIIAASEKLAGGAKDYEQAREALAALEKQLAGQGDGEKLQWRPVADVAQLMRQVPIVNNNLRRGVEGRRFERSKEKNARYAATLAAIAQASAADTSYCADEADEKAWRKYCAQLRDAAASVGQHVRGGDQQRAVAALGAVAESCNACHHAFGVK